MSVASFEDLHDHRGHTIKIVTYGNPNPRNVAIECISCSEILVDFDKVEKTDVEIPELTDSELELEFDGDVCCWGCCHCGEWIACDYGDMREHLEDCEEYKQKLVEMKIVS